MLWSVMLRVELLRVLCCAAIILVQGAAIAQASGATEFPAMGRDYDAAVVCSGFGGISLGSTPTAMANMTAVAHRYGAADLAFLVVPLVCAFFIDLVNALLIPYFIANF